MAVIRLVIAVLLLGTGGSQAQERLRFDVLFSGLKAGELEIAGRIENGRYSVAGRVESTGLVGFVRKVRYDATTRGRVQSGRFVPELYTERADTGQRKSEAEMAYRRGVPQVKVYRPAREMDPDGVDPATQGGALDPLTALFDVLRARPGDAACSTSSRTFDGQRAARVDVERVAAGEGTLVCQGNYQRIAGYSEEEMAERRVFPFTLTLARNGGGAYEVRTVELQSLFGRTRLIRR